MLKAKAARTEPLVQPPQPAELKPTNATIEVPMLRTGFYASRRIDNSLPTAEAQTLADIRDGLRASKQTLADGKIVDSTFDTLRWILQRFAGRFI